MRNSPTLITLFYLILTSLVALAAPPTPIDPANYTAPIRVACVGDSITKGAGAEKGKSYPDQLQALLGDKWNVQNFGVSGRTLLKKGNAPIWKEKLFQDAHDFNPDVVIIMLGTNDTKPQNWVHKDEFIADYKDMIETFKNLPAKPRIFICRPCPVFAQGKFGINEANVDLEIPMIDQVATEESVDVIDMHAVLDGKPEMSKDNVHPNTAGAGLMAQAAAAALTGKAANSL